LLRASDFKNKEVINLKTNERLGFVYDFEICTSNGEVSAIYVPDKTKFFLNSKVKSIRIPWEKILGIGEDIVTVDIEIPQ